MLRSIVFAATLLWAMAGSCQTRPSCYDCNGKGATFAGFDRNEYPGDDAWPELHKRFAFTGYWLNNPPGARTNTWLGKREAIRKSGFGFLVLVNGHINDELVARARRHVPPEALGRKDAEEAIATAKREGFPKGTILFLDQEEGGRLLPEAAAYLFAWSETVAHSVYRPGAYLSGIPSDDGTDSNGRVLSITTAEDVRERVAAKHLTPIAFFVYQDGCPPSNGCAVNPPPLSQSGTNGAILWQYAQSPRRPALTKSCAMTYASDGNCYTSTDLKLPVDLDVANSPDPSHGR